MEIYLQEYDDTAEFYGNKLRENIKELTQTIGNDPEATPGIAKRLCLLAAIEENKKTNENMSIWDQERCVVGGIMENDKIGFLIREAITTNNEDLLILVDHCITTKEGIQSTSLPLLFEFFDITIGGNGMEISQRTADQLLRVLLFASIGSIGEEVTLNHCFSISIPRRLSSFSNEILPTITDIIAYMVSLEGCPRGLLINWCNSQISKLRKVAADLIKSSDSSEKRILYRDLVTYLDNG